MFAALRKFISKRRQSERHLREPIELAALPPVECCADALRSMDDAELRGLLESPERAEEWRVAGARLGEVVDIADGTTSGVNPGDRRALWCLVRGLRPRSVLEVGTHVGASTSHIAAAMLASSREEPAFEPRLVTLDIRDVNDGEEAYWRKLGLPRSPRQAMEELGCGGFVGFVTENSLAWMERCRERFDLIFLDGDHSAVTVYREVPRALAMLEPGGVILLHDYFPGMQPLWEGKKMIPGPCLAIERLVKEGAPLRVLPLGDLPWPTKLGSRRTSLGLLVKG